MKLPRITVRRLMVAVAIFGIMAGGGVEARRRHDRFLAVAERHWWATLTWPLRLDPREFEWHRAMQAKYERAARYPWLPVAPDTPVPE
jgi:hypothetical protein